MARNLTVQEATSRSTSGRGSVDVGHRHSGVPVCVYSVCVCVSTCQCCRVYVCEPYHWLSYYGLA